ncbi:hypothetical protein QBC38DRAFT_35086 [Podospora fimiseda]|uniref:NACHT domain-containing protein n=1 Tax=Podospora fimiseda TaxID=252190 RepID=A0AAN7GT58_9PEZI|nr:hypothetical protein QBC38DRAFT_35086 [Podospora fimiseda]
MSDNAACNERKAAEPGPINSDDAVCWQEAIRVGTTIHNLNQKKGPTSSKYIQSLCEITSTEHARDLMQTAFDSYQKTRKKRGFVATVMIQICRNIQQYSRAIDAFIQSDPGIAGLIWGSIRLLLQIGEEQERASRLASEGILQIILHAGRWEQVSAISGLLNSARIRVALVALYVNVLDFLLSAKKWLDQSTLKRIGVSIFDSKAGKLQGKTDNMKRAAEQVDKELQTLSTYKGLVTLHAINADLYALMDKMDGMLNEARNLSDYVLKLDHELLTSTRQNSASVQLVLADLKMLPLTITHSIMSHIEAGSNLTNIKKWLVLNAVEQPPPTPHTEGTCSWLLRHPAFLEWDGSDQGAVLWVNGHPGSGKSVMSGYLEDHLLARGHDMLFSYRFQRSASNTQSTPTRFAASLVYQLLSKLSQTSIDARGTYIRDLQTLMARFPLGPQQCAFSAIWAVASSLLSKKSKAQKILIVDAMDECVFDTASEPGFLVFLQTLLETVKTTNVRLVVFARPEAELMGFLEQQLPFSSIFLSHDLVSPDVTKFAQVAYEKSGLPQSELPQVMEFVGHSAHGSFRWVELFLDHLSKSVTVEELRARIRITLPPSIGDLYRQAMTTAAEMFTPPELACRRSLLLMIYQAQRPLKKTEIVDALSLLPEKSELVISRLCKPLASTYGGIFHLSHPSVREFFDDLDEKADNSFGIWFADSDSVMAERCLNCLMDKRYADLDRIANYIKANYDEKVIIDTDAEPPAGGFYDYAFRFWDHHLVRVKNPTAELLQWVNKFIVSLQFAYWSEKSRQDCGQLVRVNVLRGSLVSWYKKLCKEDQALIELNKFFVRPYSLLIEAFAAEYSDHTQNKFLPSLALMTMGDYYCIRGLGEELSQARRAVFLELDEILGPQHRLTLRAHSDLAFVHILDGKMVAAQRMYAKALIMQREVYGEQSQCYLETCAFKGQSEFYMGDFVSAVMTWTKLSADSLAIMGPDSWIYLGAQWWLALGLAYLGQLESALSTAQSVVKKRRDLFGPTDTFGDIVQITVGEMQLLLGRYDEAIASISDVMIRTREGCPLDESLVRLDGEFVLAAAYYTAGGRDEEAVEIINEVEPFIKARRFDFQRQCQLIHLKSLLLVRNNKLDEAIHLLQSTLSEAELDQENRILLWIRLDLAKLLRARNSPGDVEQAAANFDHLVGDISGEELGAELFPDEPDPPRFWKVAEQALMLIRDRKHVEAKRLLEAEGVEWKRGGNGFWVWWSGNFSKDLLRVDERDLEGDFVCGRKVDCEGGGGGPGGGGEDGKGMEVVVRSKWGFMGVDIIAQNLRKGVLGSWRAFGGGL